MNHKPDRPIGRLPALKGHLVLWYNISRPVQVANKHVSEAVLCNTGSQDTRSTTSLSVFSNAEQNGRRQLALNPYIGRPWDPGKDALCRVRADLKRASAGDPKKGCFKSNH